MKSRTIHVIGVDLKRQSEVPCSVLESCPTIVGSSRLVDVISKYSSYPSGLNIIPITPLAGALEKIEESLSLGDVAVLASGDPLFFGIGRKLLQTFGADNVKIYPSSSSVQHAFAQFGIPWDDTSFVSLHGRTPENVVGTLLSHYKTAILTDGTNRPEIIAQGLLAFLGENSKQFTIHVAENIGMQTEKNVTGTIADIAEMRFGSLCCMLLLRNVSKITESTFRFGLSEEDIFHSRGLITKREVRAAALHALAIPANSIMWDVGAGSGSVGLEAARMNRDSLVYSIEKETEQHQNILTNIKKHDVVNMKMIPEEAPLGLHGLPRPHRIFIGGVEAISPRLSRYVRDNCCPTVALSSPQY